MSDNVKEIMSLGWGPLVCWDPLVQAILQKSHKKAEEGGCKL